MKKKLFISSMVVIMVIISATIVLSNPGWGGIRYQLWDKDKLVNLEGKVKDIYGPLVIIESGGKDYVLGTGPYWYWQEKEYKIEKGKSIKVTGMVVEIDGKQNIFPQKIVIDGKEMIFSDENGIPVWAGQGRRYGRNRYANYTYRYGNVYCWRWKNVYDNAK